MTTNYDFTDLYEAEESLVTQYARIIHKLDTMSLDDPARSIYLEDSHRFAAWLIELKYSPESRANIYDEAVELAATL